MRRSIYRDESGASLVEAALVFPMFLAMLLGLIQVGVLGFIIANFDNALVSASRKIRTGQSDGPTDAAGFVSAICTGMGMSATSCASRLTVVVQADSSPSLVLAKPAPTDNLSHFGQVAAKNYVLVTAKFRWPVVIPFLSGAFPTDSAGNVVLTNKLLFRNEPYAS